MPEPASEPEQEALPRTTFVFHFPEPFAGHDWTLSPDKTRLVRFIGCARFGCKCGGDGGVTEVRMEPGEPEPDYDAVCREARERCLAGGVTPPR